MTENKALIDIHKAKVLKSVLFIPLAIPIFLLIILLTETGGEEIGGVGAIGFLFLALIYGAIIWIPTIGLCLLIESIILSFSATKKAVLGALILEALLASTILPAIFGVVLFYDGTGVYLAVAIVVTQLIRWWYLVTNKRMFQKEADDKLSEVLDDMEIE